MRKLYLVNDKGLEFHFNDKVLISGIDGLGVSRDNSYLKYGSSYKVGSINYLVNDITMLLIFIDGYAGYELFMNYLSSSTELKLYYLVNSLNFCKVSLSGITKRELSFGTLQCELTLNKLSAWLKRYETFVELEVFTLKKIYSYSYPFTYAKPSSGSITINNNGSQDAHTYIKFVGNVDNPTVEIIKDGVIYQTLRLLINGTYDIEVSSIADDEFIRVNGVNMYGIQDFTCKNFLTLPVGESNITFDPGTTNNVNIFLAYEEEYEGV
jgi:hypothetical protein